jgi:GT2 family glycosyltransferase
MLNSSFKSPTLVSMVVLNWNGKAFIQECIDSLLHTTYPNFELIVIDNASDDGSVELLRAYGAKIRLVINECNVGYAAGNNIGFKIAQGAFVAAINNDIVVEPDWLSQLIPRFEADERIGAISCRQMMPSPHNTVIDGLYHRLRPELFPSPIAVGERYCQDNPQQSASGYVLSVNGGAAVYRKSMLDELGGFDERFYAYMEEADLCLRGFWQGWRSYYEATAIVYHRGSASFKKKKAYMYYLRERNRIWFITKHIPSSLIIRKIVFVFAWEIRVWRVFFLVLRNPASYARARLDAFKGIKLFLQERMSRGFEASLVKKMNSFFREPLQTHWWL